ncbi:MAG TPA: hypothetical protein VNS61_10395 [Caldimonas sp.]|nr:hypothetical protein [Caldimonas sp.]
MQTQRVIDCVQALVAGDRGLLAMSTGRNRLARRGRYDPNTDAEVAAAPGS